MTVSGASDVFAGTQPLDEAVALDEWTTGVVTNELKTGSSLLA